MAGQVLTVEHVSKRFGRRVVLKDISFSSSAGSLVGIVGENGSGKSTLLKVLAGLLPSTGGAFHIRGRLGYCPQQVMLNEALTVRQHLEYFSAAYRIPGQTFGLELVERLAFSEYLDRPVVELSGGTQQKLNLTIALMHRPTVLLLDEPYQGFDWETYLRFWKLAEELRGEGACLVIISHLVFDKARFSSIYDLKNGRLRPEATAPDASPTEKDR